MQKIYNMKNFLEKEKFLIITFDTMTMAIYMDRLCKQENLPGKSIPVPKEIDKGCGSAFATKNYDKDFWIGFMKEHNVKYSQMTILDI